MPEERPASRGDDHGHPGGRPLVGRVITESVFGIPGVGRIAVNAIQARDMPLLQGAILFSTVLVIAGNLVADILYAFLDPRIRYAMQEK